MSLPNYFMVSDCTGDLFDTRKEGWHKRPPIRPNYGKIARNVKNNNTALKAAIRTKYTWPGGYEFFGIADDGACICCDCMRNNYHQIVHSRLNDINDGWRIVAIDCAADYDEYIYCDHCNKTIVEGWEEEEAEENND